MLSRKTRRRFSNGVGNGTGTGINNQSKRLKSGQKKSALRKTSKDPVKKGMDGGRVRFDLGQGLGDYKNPRIGTADFVRSKGGYGRRYSAGYYEDVKRRKFSIHTRWFSPSDLERFRKECTYTVKLLMDLGKVDEIEYSQRGLESMSRAGALQVKRQRRYAQSVTFKEQERQKQMFGGQVVDCDRLSQIYAQACERSLVAAVARGGSDAKDAG